jgi:alanine racemase
MKSLRATRLFVDTNKIIKNIDIIQNYIGKKIQIMPIIKANAYGTYINYCLKVLNKFDLVGVSLVDEAVKVRENGYKGDIFILYPPVQTELDDILNNDFSINGSNLNILRSINDLSKNKIINIHLEIETGMGRTGIQIKDLNNFLFELKKLKNINIVGAFTHFASSSNDLGYTNIQIERFEEALKIIKSNNIKLKYIHTCNSGAIFNFKNNYYNMVRIGLLLYGYYPNKKFKSELKLYPSTTLKTKINFIKKIDVGETVGYNKNFVAKRESIIATIPFGFGDGLIGLETDNPYVIINNKKAKIIGICMDNMMLDVTDIKNVNYDSDVIIWDNENLTIEKIASWIPGLCSYEILCSLSDRIPREIVGDINE